MLFNINLLIIIAIFLIFLVEKNTKANIIFNLAKYPKSQYNAEAASSLNAFVYFLINTAGFIWHIKKDLVDFTFITTIIWIVTISFLVIFVKKISLRIQVIDKSKADDDFT